MPIVRTGTRDPLHRRLEPAPATTDVLQVHRLADHEVGVRVEAADELVAVIVEVALDLEALPEREPVLQVGHLATEAVGEHVVGPERDLRDLPRDREALVGTVAGRGVVVVAAPPLRVEPNGPTPDAAERDLLRGRLRARCDREERSHTGRDT